MPLEDFYYFPEEYAPQKNVDSPKNHYWPEGAAFDLTTQIDRTTDPASEFRWYKNGQAVGSWSVNRHTLTLDPLTYSDEGTYTYRIRNSALPGLVLESHPQTLSIGEGQMIRYCLEFEFDLSNNPGLALFTFNKSWEQIAEECREAAVERNEAVIENAVERLVQQELNTWFASFTTNCIELVEETFTYTYTPKEYHYTLYYYDQAGNLVQTTPPQGVQPLDQSGVSAVLDGTETYPGHTLNTRYGYNSRDQLIWQQTPDAGESRFWYNRAGQLRLSQDAKQANKNAYSYTRYDAKGRVTEVGELLSTEPTDSLKAKINTLTWPDLNEYTAYDITKTVYDKPHTHADSTFLQENLRSRVSWTAMIEKDQQDTVITLYSYDEHGNVKGLLQQIPGLAPKRTEYVYDLVSGNVNFVMYQYGYDDQFIHRYSYDADNRIEYVHTSTVAYLWISEATYHYYPHGPLARVELGEYNVQGMDYYYTLQGWLKGVNMPGEGDMGADGLNGLRTGKDAFAFTLGYHANDFKPINPNAVTS
ncbi:hypothetical protein KIH41_17375, partial [Litoribacter ruber]|uniref:immunoglobulin domain-containing protein n=1 Tax=Litoribacter ruber TaxID=702568 RepID=UPI001BD98841